MAIATQGTFMKVIAPNAFAPKARTGPPQAMIVGMSRALQNLFGGPLQEPLPPELLALVRRLEEEPGHPG